MEELEDTFYGMLCNNSCEHRCGLSTVQWPARCYCDWACLRLGDCCLDYEASCLAGPNVTRDNYTDILRSRKSPVAKCVEIPEGTMYQDNFKMVSDCDSELIPATDLRTIDLCERRSEKIISTEIPVMYRDVIYRNIYCAICNHHGENLTGVKTPEVAIACGNTSGTASDYNRQRFGCDIEQQHTVSNCEVKFNLSSLDRKMSHLHGSLSRYTCVIENNATGVCNADLTDPRFDFDYLRSICMKYRASVLDRSSFAYFDNPHCAMCNGVVDTSHMRCHARDVPDIVPFSDILKFIDLDKFPGLCLGDTVLDHMTGACVTPTCPPGHVRLPKKQCAGLNVTIAQLYSAKRDGKVHIVMSTESKHFGYFAEEAVSMDIGIEVVANSVTCDACTAFAVWKNWDQIVSNTSTCCIQETLSNNFAEVVSKVDAFAANVNSNHELLSFYNLMQVDIFVYSVNNQDACGLSNTCLYGSPRIRRDIVIVGDPLFLFRDTIPSTFLVVSTSQVYNLTEVPVIASWRSKHSTNARWIDSEAALVCELDIFSCDTVTFQADEYIDEGESLVIYNGTAQEVHILQINVLRLDSNAIVLCATTLPNQIGIDHGDDDTGRYIKAVLSLIGNILSMASIVITITTYCMFAQIRTRAGICVMNLCVALFFAQLSFQVNDTLVSYPEVCAVLAAFQHYAWLVAFLWMNVLAFDMSCTFADLKPANVAADTSRLRLFAVYAWGLPAVFVALCLVLDLATNLPFSYGSSTMCWIAGHRAVVYYFATPLAVVIAANVVLFVRTVVGLRRALTIASKARQPQQQRKTFVIYVRLTSLMGFTWLFGFLANIDVLSFLSYPFILCNTCQGVFIGVSFVMTPTVRHIWVDWFKANKKTSDVPISLKYIGKAVDTVPTVVNTG